MKLKEYLLNEWKVLTQYAGREIVVPKKTILWYYMIAPVPAGLIWLDPKGNIFTNSKKIGKTIPSDDPKATHKRLLAEVYYKIGLDKKLGSDLRNNVENLMEKNVRGRIVRNTIYVWNTETSYMRNKAIDAIYRYIDEKLTK